MNFLSEIYLLLVKRPSLPTSNSFKCSGQISLKETGGYLSVEKRDGCLPFVAKRWSSSLDFFHPETTFAACRVCIQKLKLLRSITILFVVNRGVVLKRSGGRLKQDLDKDFKTI